MHRASGVHCLQSIDPQRPFPGLEHVHHVYRLRLHLVPSVKYAREGCHAQMAQMAQMAWVRFARSDLSLRVILPVRPGRQGEAGHDLLQPTDPGWRAEGLNERRASRGVRRAPLARGVRRVSRQSRTGHRTTRRIRSNDRYTRVAQSLSASLPTPDKRGRHHGVRLPPGAAGTLESSRTQIPS